MAQGSVSLRFRSSFLRYISYHFRSNFFFLNLSETVPRSIVFSVFTVSGRSDDFRAPSEEDSEGCGV
jgi:hypothetical protein